MKILDDLKESTIPSGRYWETGGVDYGYYKLSFYDDKNEEEIQVVVCARSKWEALRMIRVYMSGYNLTEGDIQPATEEEYHEFHEDGYLDYDYLDNDIPFYESRKITKSK